MKKLGYTAGVFDLFHVGHLNVIKKAKEQCDYLIVAVSTDELVQKYKNKLPIIPYEERKAIIQSIRYVDEVVPQIDRDKIAAFQKYHFDVMFVGDDWKGNSVFNEVELYMKNYDKEVIYIPHTPNISSTILKEVLLRIYGEEG